MFFFHFTRGEKNVPYHDTANKYAPPGQLCLAKMLQCFRQHFVEFADQTWHFLNAECPQYGLLRIPIKEQMTA